MKIFSRKWFAAIILVGLLYLFIGIAFGAFADWSGSTETQKLWRLAAWLVSAIVFALHIWYEHSKIQCSPRNIALHVSSAAALGAFGLAIAANIHAYATASGNRTLLAIALLVWPLMTWIPAFVVALAAAAVLARMRRGA